MKNAAFDQTSAMKLWHLLFLTVCIACNQQGKESAGSSQKTDQPQPATNQPSPKQHSSTIRYYSNQRFKDVKVEQTGENKFHLTGKAQVFEAAFSWVVEDG